MEPTYLFRFRASEICIAHLAKAEAMQPHIFPLLLSQSQSERIRELTSRQIPRSRADVQVLVIVEEEACVLRAGRGCDPESHRNGFAVHLLGGGDHLLCLLDVAQQLRGCKKVKDAAEEQGVSSMCRALEPNRVRVGKPRIPGHRPLT